MQRETTTRVFTKSALVRHAEHSDCFRYLASGIARSQVGVAQEARLVDREPTLFLGNNAGPAALPLRYRNQQGDTYVDVLAPRQDPDPDRRRGAARTSDSCVRRARRVTSCSARRWSRRSPRDSASRCSGWAASGVRSASSGRPTASTRRLSVTRVGSPRTRRTKRCAAGVPVTPKSCSSCSIRPRRATTTCCASSGRITIRRRACARATTSGRSTARRSTRTVPSSSPPPSVRARCSRRSSTKSGYGEITTEIVEAPEFYYAEDYHQQYLAKNPGGYCGMGGTGVSCPIGLARTD